MQPHHMASPPMMASSLAGHSRGIPAYQAPPAPVPVSKGPPGALASGTTVSVGKHKVTIDRFLSEGGFAHVYLATSDQPIPAGSPNATRKHVLKRMLAPDTRTVAQIGKEVEVMKLLKDHPRIVNFIEASCTELPNKRGYEIYILMEWCAGGGIIDMMNTRLQNRLTESEILKIFSDTVEAVAHMHYQSPPLIHRDLKVENILLCPPNTYKLCDFGSTVTPLKRIPTAVPEIQALELEINKSTTLQYRAPELVDVWSRKGYDEKIDIWALGVLLYKLCYYTTPFEEQGPLAILNAQYKFPPYPAYSNSIKRLIASMLVERAASRPNIFQVHEQVCKLRGVAVRLEDKYAGRATMSAPSSEHSKPQASVSTGPSLPTGPSVADIASTISPMRRGRPGKAGPSDAVAPVQPDIVEQPRKVRTGLASMAGAAGEKAGSSGFGDSFDDKTATAFASTADRELGESSSLFQDLVKSSSNGLKKDTGGDAAYAALGDSDNLPPSLGGSGIKPQPERQSSKPLEVSRESETTTGPSAVASARAKFELTGEKTPDLPRRPPGKGSQDARDGRSDRSQQTSPWLLELARREHGYAAAPETTANSEKPASVPSASPTPAVPAKDSPKLVQEPIVSSSPKQPSRDLLGDDDDDDDWTRVSAPALSSTAFAPASSPPSDVKRDVESSELPESAREKFKPVNKRMSIIPKSASDQHLDAADRFPSLEEFDAKSPSPSSSNMPKKLPDTISTSAQAKEGRQDERWTDVVEKAQAEEDSSDDDDFTPRPLPKAGETPSAKPADDLSPPQSAADPSRTRSLLDSSPGDAPERRLSVKERIKSPPAIIAPKPQSVKKQAAISSLVSRFEGLSPDESGNESGSSSATRLVRQPTDIHRAPPPSSKPKPASLRSNWMGSQDKTSPTLPTVSSTPPSSSALPSSPPANLYRLPFRPTPPSTASPVRHAPRPSSFMGSSQPLPGLARSGSRPSIARKPNGLSGGSSTTSTLRTDSTSSPSRANDQDGDDEERFAGVANMKNRWESLSKSNGPGKPPAVRKEDGII